jgi:hypothetical protein
MLVDARLPSCSHVGWCGFVLLRPPSPGSFGQTFGQTLGASAAICGSPHKRQTRECIFKCISPCLQWSKVSIEAECRPPTRREPNAPFCVRDCLQSHGFCTTAPLHSSRRPSNERARCREGRRSPAAAGGGASAGDRRPARVIKPNLVPDNCWQADSAGRKLPLPRPTSEAAQRHAGHYGMNLKCPRSGSRVEPPSSHRAWLPGPGPQPLT